MLDQISPDGDETLAIFTAIDSNGHHCRLYIIINLHCPRITRACYTGEADGGGDGMKILINGVRWLEHTKQSLQMMVLKFKNDGLRRHTGYVLATNYYRVSPGMTSFMIGQGVEQL